MLAYPICHKFVVKEWLKSGFFECKYSYTDEGSPKERVISSPSLCNIALNGIEHTVNSFIQ